MAKIISITPTGQWNEFFKFEVRFEDGDFGTAFAKSNTPPYAVGDDVTYEKTEKGSIKNIKKVGFTNNYTAPFAKSAAGGDDRGKSIIRQVALKSAVEMSASYVAQGATIPVEKIFELADKFNAWMLNEQKGATHEEHFAPRVEESSPF
jgi:hypothetical protein